jgi:excisionase family DNA binding protein
MERLLTAKELAALWGVNEDWVYERAADGDLPSYKLGHLRRFRASEAEEWLQRHRQGETEAGTGSRVAGSNVRQLRG